MQIKIETERLVLRPWIDADAEPMAEINQDEKVIEFLPGPTSLKDTKFFIQGCNQHIAKHGFGLLAVELKESKKLIGFLGIQIPAFETSFTPCVEIGWRLSSKYWGQGYATEGAKAALKFGFEKIKLKEIVAFTVPQNLRSISVMKKIGMKRDMIGDFEHPRIPKGHKLSHHLLYRIKNDIDI